MVNKRMKFKKRIESNKEPRFNEKFSMVKGNKGFLGNYKTKYGFDTDIDNMSIRNVEDGIYLSI